MNDFNPLELTAGDLFGTGNTLCVHDDADKTVWFIRDGEKIIIQTNWKNLQAVLDANAREAAEFNATGKMGDLVKVATIPNGIYYDWKSKGYTDDPEKMARLLNDADYGKLRTNGLRI